VALLCFFLLSDDDVFGSVSDGGGARGNAIHKASTVSLCVLETQRSLRLLRRRKKSLAGDIGR
jgi:hypothetical protein